MILENKECLQEFKEMWNEWIENKRFYTNQSLFWEHSKNKIISFLKKAGKARKEKRKIRREELEKELKQEREKETSTSDIERLVQIKNELTWMDKEEERGQIIRSRVDWRDQGEKPTSYFYNLEKENGEKRKITALKNSDGDRVTKHKEIEEVILQFYQELYTETPTDPQAQEEILKHINNQVKDEHKEDLEELLS